MNNKQSLIRLLLFLEMSSVCLRFISTRFGIFLVLFLVTFYTDKVDGKIKLWKHINQHKLLQIDSTSLHLLFQRNFTSLNVINYQDFHYGIALPDIHLDLVFINDVLLYQTLCPITLILQLPRYHRKQFLGGTSALS